MALSLAITGLPNVGKSTLFNALTKNNVLAANYPFATIEPNVGIVGLPDERLAKLAALYNSAKITPATVTFVDIAGIVKGASEGEGLGNKFLANIRECDAIVQVVRAFEDANVTHVDGKVDPKSDIETIHTELILADLQTLKNRLDKLESEAKRDSKLSPTLEVTRRIQNLLNDGVLASAGGLDAKELDLIRDLQLLTSKPFIYVFNLSEADLDNSAKRDELTALVPNSQTIFLCAEVESSLRELATDEANELLQSLGQAQSGLDQLATVGFKTLGLQTYLTSGPDETRAWTIPQGATAPEAAGVIHTDFQKGFIKAEVVSYDDLMVAGSMSGAKAAGKVRLEGKDYVMADGDVVEFRFNV